MYINGCHIIHIDPDHVTIHKYSLNGSKYRNVHIRNTVYVFFVINDVEIKIFLFKIFS